MSQEPTRLKFRIIVPVIRAAGLVPWALVFVLLFLSSSTVVFVFEPGVSGFANAAWLMFQVVTTIGLGDFTCVTVFGRAAAIVLSVYSIFYLALVTGAVVSYCSERMRAHRNESVAQFIVQLEHLDELSKEELAEISRKVRAFQQH